MAPNFQVSAKFNKIQVRLDEMPGVMRERLRSVAKSLELELLALAKSRASGDVLQVKSGDFVKSIRGSVRSTKRAVTGRVFSKDPRAMLFEWGGSTPARDILPNTAMAMAFMGSTGQVFASIVHRPVVQYDARHILGGAFVQMKGDIEAEMTGAVRDAAAEA